ncbi:MAG: hypothetical protein ACRDPW_09295 [Mycobacteriales bacterium]
MVAALLPIGQYAGQFFTAAGQSDPAYHEVRLGGDFIRITSIEHATWAVAHNDPELLADGAQPNRTAIETAMRQLGFDDIDEPLANLHELGLIGAVVPVGGSLRKFAELHRIVPQVLGLGNTTADLDNCLVGTPGEPRLSMSFDVYQVWLASELHRCLWDACEQVATAFQTAGREQGSSAAAGITPAALLHGCYRCLPVLIATGCAYLDTRR